MNLNPYRIAFAAGFALIHVVASLPPGKRLVCHLAGHDDSWVLGAAMGFGRPVCVRCKAVL